MMQTVSRCGRCGVSADSSSYPCLFIFNVASLRSTSYNYEGKFGYNTVPLRCQKNVSFWEIIPRSLSFKQPRGNSTQHARHSEIKGRQLENDKAEECLELLVEAEHD